MLQDLYSNYHTHTWRCGHAEPNERKYVENAIAAGIRYLGFSDHTPYFFENGYYSTFRMKPEMFENYVSTVLALKEEYKKDITIHLGVEAEFYPNRFDKLLRFLSQYPVEYMICGQHYTNDETDGVYSGLIAHDRETLHTYVEQCKDAMRTGRFLYLAHPDLLYYPDEPEVYRTEMRSLLEEAKKLDVPVEVNLNGIKWEKHYPNETTWKLAAEVGNEVVLGWDVHDPADFENRKRAENAIAWAKQLGVKAFTGDLEDRILRNADSLAIAE